jgi:hypothetical protein
VRLLVTSGAAAVLLAACASPSPSAGAEPVKSSVRLSESPHPAPLSPSETATSRFVWDVTTVTAADLPHSWREGCPVPPSALRAVRLRHYDFEGQVRAGVLVVSADVVAQAEQAFAALFQQRFPIRSIRPVDDFGGSDDASMAADNTSGFNCRAAVNDSGSVRWSKHAYGRAIDVNPVENPYVLAGRVLPPEGGEYTDRGLDRPGMLLPGSPALRAFADAGFAWGGVWSNPDYQHLEWDHADPQG